MPTSTRYGRSPNQFAGRRVRRSFTRSKRGITKPRFPEARFGRTYAAAPPLHRTDGKSPQTPTIVVGGVRARDMLCTMPNACTKHRLIPCNARWYKCRRRGDVTY